MRLERMGSFHQSRLSFMRVLLRRLKQQNWQFSRPVWDIDANGVGRATYQAQGPQHTYTLIAFGHELPDDLRSDRVIAEAWDATFTLFDGIPANEDIERLSRNVPLQEAGRISEKELSLARANKSVRLFNHVVDSLAKGTQPDPEQISTVGYLMRTTAVYGSGKFGASDRTKWAERGEFRGSFQPEMLCVWLIRAFTIDLVEHLAKHRSGSAVKLSTDIRHQLGVGNSTGLGMAPFLVNHPRLLHRWIDGRETALRRVRALPATTSKTFSVFRQLVARSHANACSWRTGHAYQAEKVKNLIEDFRQLEIRLGEMDHTDAYPWNTLIEWAEATLSLEGQECLVSLVLEPHGQLVDELADTMQIDEADLAKPDVTQSVSDLNRFICSTYGWVAKHDFSRTDANARVWYVSAEKLEPRLGERFEEDLNDYEQPLAPARDIAALQNDIADQSEDTDLAEFVRTHPQHRHIIRRIQLMGQYPYGEIRDNTVSASMMPIDMLRCKLSFFGATKFDPRSDRWVRINMFQGAPYPHELSVCDPDDMAYPQLDNA